MLRSTRSVILSEQSESKDLRTFRFASRHSVRRSFDFGLRPSLRMTSCAAAPNPSPGGKVAPKGSDEECGRSSESQNNITDLHWSYH